MTDEFKEAFKEETRDVIASIDNLLVDLETASDNEENKILLFRHLHTIKGGAGMFGYVKIADLVHDIETVLEPYKQGEIADVGAEVINQLLSSMDFIRFLVDTDEEQTGNFKSTKEGLIAGLKAGLMGEEISLPVSSEGLAQETSTLWEEDPESVASLPNVEQEAGDDFSLYRIDLLLCEDFLFTGNRPHFLLNDLTELGEMRTFADTSRLPNLSDLNTDKFYLRWIILLASLADLETVEDVFLFIGAESTAKVSILKSGATVERDLLKTTLSDITSFGFGLEEVNELLENSDMLHPLVEELEQEVADPVAPEVEEVRDTPTSPAPPVEPAMPSIPTATSPNLALPVPAGGVKNESIQRIRVDSRRLDGLVDLVGELVTLQGGLSQKLKAGHYNEIESLSEKLDFIVQELRDVTTSMRMVPIQGTFTKFQRLVRDLSHELGKKVEYITQGGDTELDKSIIEKLDEPLVHLIRNSLDHGIETPEVRTAAGKSEKAFLRIAAQQNGANITIQIQDDGGGLDRDAIGCKAVERGLVSSYQDLTDEAIHDFIFSPGFSTAERVTNLSGRGVGLSVVKAQVESLRGNIKVRTESGKGTTFSLVFPLTLAIIEGFLVRVGREFFVIPLVIVEACLEYKTVDLERQQVERGGFMSFRDKVLPCLELCHFFEVEGDKPDIQQIVIVRTNQTMIGIVVDEVIGKHQTVIKSLGEVYRNVKGVSSATILGDGGIALLLDVEAIVDLHLLQAKEAAEILSHADENGVFLD